MSANRAVAPASRIALSVATNVNGLVITSSPGCEVQHLQRRDSAVVPLLTATACRAPTSSANPSSNRATIGPCAIIPDRRVSRTSRSTSSPKEILEIAITVPPID